MSGSVFEAPALVAGLDDVAVMGETVNYRDHTAETDYKQPDYPTLFPRFTTSPVAHLAPIVRPRVSHALDFEGELVAVIGRGGRHIPAADALSHVAGYSIFNDGSLRDFQHRTPQWTVGKNFDSTGAFGPVFVTGDELPRGARGLRLETRLNGEVVQTSNTDHLIFDVPTLVSTISEVMTLVPGDLIVTGTPAGIGHSRSPKLYMKPGDVVEVEIEGIGILSNGIVDENSMARKPPSGVDYSMVHPMGSGRSWRSNSPISASAGKSGHDQ